MEPMGVHTGIVAFGPMANLGALRIVVVLEPPDPNLVLEVSTRRDECA